MRRRLRSQVTILTAESGSEVGVRDSFGPFTAGQHWLTLMLGVFAKQVISVSRHGMHNAK